MNPGMQKDRAKVMHIGRAIAKEMVAAPGRPGISLNTRSTSKTIH